MAVVIPFPLRRVAEPEDDEVDLLTAVDVAIRDLRDIAEWLQGASRHQAEECRQMLERAFAAASEAG